MKYQSSNSKKVYNIDFNQKSSLCVECSHTRKKKKDKTVTYYPDTNTAYCFHCNTTFFEYKPYEAKQYKKPEWKNITKLSDKAVKWFTSRMISQETINKMKIYSDIEYMMPFEKEIDVICFPFFMDNELKNIKFRGAKKSFKLFSGAELIFYNIDCLKDNESIIITEGEIDCLTFIENGFYNTISVPNGANINLEYLDNYITLFDVIKDIYLATDNDTKGIELRDELIRRFGADKCNIISFKECKDANEYFIKYGGLEFKEAVKNSRPVPIDGIVHIESIHNDIIDLYENGIQRGLTINQDEIDKFISWELGRLAIVTGVPGSGKSEFIDYLVCKLNLIHKWKAAFFTPENYPLKYHYRKLHEKFSGKYFDKKTDTTDFDTIYEHVSNNFFYIMNEENMQIEVIMNAAKSLIKQKGIKILVIDPYNKLEHQYTNKENETQYVSRFLDILTNFAKFNNILIFLIAHPTKMPKGEIPSLYNISGSANFYNKTDYGFTVHRLRDNDNLMVNEVKVFWQKIKFKNLGEQGISELKYNYNNGRFENNENDVNHWDNSNWIEKNNNLNIISDDYPIKDCPF